MNKFLRWLVSFAPVGIFLAVNIIVTMVAMFALVFFTTIQTMIGQEAGVNAADSMMNLDVLTLLYDRIIPITFAFQLLTLLGLGFWFFKWHYKSENIQRKALGAIPILKVILVILTGVIGMQLLLEGIFVIMSMYTPKIVEDYNSYMEMAGVADTTVLSVICTVIMAPLVEEITFRGLTIRLMEKATSKFWLINIIQAVMFGLVHGTPVQMCYAFVLGIFFGTHYQKYRSIWICVLFHFVYNLMGGYLLTRFLEMFTADGIYLSVVLVVGTILFVVSLWLLIVKRT